MQRPEEIVLRRVIEQIATEQEAQNVAAWLATDSGQAWLSEQMDRDAEMIAQGVITHYEDIPTEKLLANINRIITRANQRRILFRVAAVLIPCALIIGLWADLNGRLGGQLLSPPKTEITAAAIGERREIIFQDGTKVFLNAGTQISYPQFFGIKERRIILNGEAYFNVAHNPKRPFVVQAGNASVRVLGTTFNIKAYDYEPQIDLMLIDGSVAFSCGDDRYTLAPMQKLIYDKNHRKGVITTAHYAGRETEWRENIINFRDTHMREVVSILERWYGVKFEVSDDDLYKYAFTLRTDDIPLHELLAELENIAPIKFEISKNRVIIRLNNKLKR